MKTTTLKFVALALVVGAVGVVPGNGTIAPDKTLEEIAPYRQWTRVTQQPMVVQLSSAVG